MSSTKKSKMRIIKITSIPMVKYNYEYIKRHTKKTKENPKVLFIIDVEDSHKVNKKIFDLPNVHKVNLKDVDSDYHYVKNKKLIMKLLRTIQIYANKHKYTKVVMPTIKLGSTLRKRKDVKDSYDFLITQLRRLERKLSIGPKTMKNNSGNPVKVQVSKEESKRSYDKIKNYLKSSKKYCSKCDDSLKLLKRELFTVNSSEAKDYIKSLKKGDKYCKKCIEKCDKISKKAKKMNKNNTNKVERIQSEFPIICNKDIEESTKAHKIKKQIHNRLVNQMATINVDKSA